MVQGQDENLNIWKILKEDGFDVYFCCYLVCVVSPKTILHMNQTALSNLNILEFETGKTKFQKTEKFLLMHVMENRLHTGNRLLQSDYFSIF